MRSRCLLAVLSIVTMAAGARGQAPWRGVGPKPCTGPADFAYFKCAAPAETVAVRAGRLFDSNTRRMLMKQVILLKGDRITDVGADSQIRIPPGTRIIDLS